MTATIDLLNELLSYDSSTGILKWKKDVSRRVKAGNQAGSPSSTGHINIELNGKCLKAHRVAWLLHYGKWPDLHLDHIDGNPSNNMISNLREVTRSQNMINRKMHANNKSGFKGVHKRSNGNKWKAQIKFQGKVMHLGYFDDPEMAAKAYRAASDSYHAGFQNLKSLNI